MGRHIVACALGLNLAACASLDYIHDPQFVPLSREQVPGFLKSIRCELVTFYTANGLKSQLYNNLIAIYQADMAQYQKTKSPSLLQAATAARAKGLAEYPHFDLSDQLFGPVGLDLKVIDTLGFQSPATVVNYKHTLDMNHSFGWQFGPEANTQNTYDLTYNFIIRQDATLYDAPDTGDGFACFKTLPPKSSTQSAELDALAKGDHPDLELFKRIRVNLTTPLAAWLQSDSTELWSNAAARNDIAEIAALSPQQINLSFTVQVTAGLDTQYNLMGPLLSGTADFNANSQSSGNMQLSLNGPDAVLYSNAQIGNSGILSGTPYTPPLPKKTEAMINVEQILKSKGIDLDKKGLALAQRRTATLLTTPNQAKIVQQLTQNTQMTEEELNNLLNSNSLAVVSRSTLQRSAPRIAGPMAAPLPPGSRGYLLYPIGIPVRVH
jgi:hypothetical protein